jgi:hypothetical protein
MEEALVLGKLSHRVPRDIITKIKGIEGVKKASLILGPYDFYALVSTKTKEMLSDLVINMRSHEGVLDTMTCYAVEFSDIRPEARGHHVE